MKKLIKTTEIDLTVDDLVSVLTNSEDQANFFNIMADHFESFSYGDKDGIQMLYIKDDLTEKGKAFIAKLYEYTCTELEPNTSDN